MRNKWKKVFLVCSHRLVPIRTMLTNLFCRKLLYRNIQVSDPSNRTLINFSRKLRLVRTDFLLCFGFISARRITCLFTVFVKHVTLRKSSHFCTYLLLVICITTSSRNNKVLQQEEYVSLKVVKFKCEDQTAMTR